MADLKLRPANNDTGSRRKPWQVMHLWLNPR